ncbi:MAG: hypothetical protein ACJ79S_05065, partial [Gemmatimonadaceae bacterium]
MKKLRETVVGILVLAAIFVVFQGGVGYFGLPRKSLWYWIVPLAAVIWVLRWYFRASDDDDWRMPAARPGP